MRRRIRSQALRERFDKAWAVLPAVEQKRLRSFIRYVDEVRELEGTFIYGRPEQGKGIEIIAQLQGGGTGYTALMNLNSRDVVDVVLPSDPLASCDESVALLIILHELAHAVDYLNGTKKAIERNHYRSERFAWTQAIAWACGSTLSDELSDEIEIHGRSAMLEDMFRRYRE